MKFQLRVDLPDFFSSALGVVDVLSRLLPRASLAVESSSRSPLVVACSLREKMLPFSFQDPNLFELAFLVIFEIKVGFTGVVSTGVPVLCVEVVRPRDSRDSAVDVVVMIEGVSLDFREFGGDVSSVSSDGLSLTASLSLSRSLSLSLVLVLSLLLNSMVKEGAAGFNFGVVGCCEDGGRVPIGA